MYFYPGDISEFHFGLKRFGTMWGTDLCPSGTRVWYDLNRYSRISEKELIICTIVRHERPLRHGNGTVDIIVLDNQDLLPTRVLDKALSRSFQMNSCSSSIP
jgi:hypothetical protein